MRKRVLIFLVVILVICALCVVHMNHYHKEKINEMRTLVINELEKSVDLSLYRDAQKKEINDLLKAAEEKINSTEEKKTAESISEDTLEEISDIKTDKQLTEEERAKALAKAKRKAIKKLKELYPKSNYRETEYTERSEKMKAAKKSINNAKNKAAVKKRLKKARKSLDEVKTAAQHEAEEEAARIAEQQRILEQQRIAAQQAAQRQAQQAQSRSRSSGSSSSDKNTEGCVGDDAENFY